MVVIWEACKECRQYVESAEQAEGAKSWHCNVAKEYGRIYGHAANKKGREVAGG